MNTNIMVWSWLPFIAIIIIVLGGVGKEQINSYQRCGVCIYEDSDEAVPCDCRTVKEYNEAKWRPITIVSLAAIMLILYIGGMLMKGDKK